MSDPMILAGDIGGTKTVLGLFEKVGPELKKVREQRFLSQKHGSFEELLTAFLAGPDKVPITTGCFGVAGAVIDGRCRTTNLPWLLDERTLTPAIGARRVVLLNDLAAMAFGMLHLRSEQFAVLQKGARPRGSGTAVVIAAGTGLGEALLHWDGRQHYPAPSEGGHVDFAPRTDREMDLLRYLQRKFDHVSYERVLSGPGLHNIYDFLRETGVCTEAATIAEKLKDEDPGAIISQEALAGGDPLCSAALELFAEMYGAEAGNLALKAVAIGGVFVGGGIAPKILPILQRGHFLRGFLHKGRFADMLKNIEVCVSLEPETPLLGAAHYAARLTGELN